MTTNELSHSTYSILTKHLATVEYHLNTELIPFWFARVLDASHGGFLTNFDHYGEALPVSEKYVNTQCRLIWWFSTLHRRFPQMPKAADMASHGVDFLIRHFWDTKHSSFFWKVSISQSRNGPQFPFKPNPAGLHPACRVLSGGLPEVFR